MANNKQTSAARRSFFVKGGAALGASLACASAGASSLVFDNSQPLQAQVTQLQQQLGQLEGKDAVRQLHLIFTALVESQAFDAVVELFTDEAQVALDGELFVGKQQGVKELFTRQYAEQKKETLYTAFRQNQMQQKDELVVSDDGSSAEAVFHHQVQISKPLLGDNSVFEQMAKLQGQSADSRWVNGKFEMHYAKVDKVWKIQSLQYLTVA